MRNRARGGGGGRGYSQNVGMDTGKSFSSGRSIDMDEVTFGGITSSSGTGAEQYHGSTHDHTIRDHLSPQNPTHSCSGYIILYSKTYLRGEYVLISDDRDDLEPLLFTDKLVSLSVSGDCCWSVFTGVNYTGDSEQFTNSESYLSTTSVGQVFRNAKSVKKC